MAAASTITMSFRFKQFFVNDDKCAMKVGTDGVLLGAWCPIPYTMHNTPYTILDVGTGSGLIALMLAQRCPETQIDAIDIDAAAVEQARENFEHSPFTSHLSAFNARLQDWSNHQSPITNHKCYDLIVANPPYFQNSLKNPDTGRQTARHTDTLSYEDLVTHSVRLLKENGQLALILPAEAEKEIKEIATAHKLSLTHITRVYSKDNKPVRRVLMAFLKSPITNKQSQIISNALVLEDEKGGRSAAYSELCQEFYL